MTIDLLKCGICHKSIVKAAGVVKLVDALDSKSSGHYAHVGSSPTSGIWRWYKPSPSFLYLTWLQSYAFDRQDQFVCLYLPQLHESHIHHNLQP